MNPLHPEAYVLKHWYKEHKFIGTVGDTDLYWCSTKVMKLPDRILCVTQPEKEYAWVFDGKTGDLLPPSLIEMCKDPIPLSQEVINYVQSVTRLMS